MNNRGQSLVLFVLMIPIAFLILMMIYNIGVLAILKNRINNINTIAMEYGLDIMEEEDAKDKINALIVKNKSNIDKIEINIEDNKLYITLEDTIDNKLSIIKIFKVSSSYVGYMEEDKKIIEKNR